MLTPDEVYDPEDAIDRELEFDEKVDEYVDRILKDNFKDGPSSNSITIRGHHVRSGWNKVRCERFIKRYRSAGWQVYWDYSETLPDFYFKWPEPPWYKRMFRSKRRPLSHLSYPR